MKQKRLLKKIKTKKDKVLVILKLGKYSLVMSVLLSMYFCENNSVVKTPNQIGNIDSLRIKTILLGDTSAFKDLRICYLDYSPEKFIPYAVYFADKYKFPMASYEVYLSICNVNGQELGKLSETMAGKKDYELAIKHLKLAANSNYYDSKEILEEQLQYSQNSQKDSTKVIE